MNLNKNNKPYTLTALAIVTAAVLFSTSVVRAQSPSPSKAKPSPWQDLGYNQVPEGVSTDVIPLFEGLNKSRGTWSFKGETSDGQSTTPFEGNLSVQGNPQAGMISMWQISLGWPAKDPDLTLSWVVMASPNWNKKTFDLRLFRIGPANPKEKIEKNNPAIKPTMFAGKWDLSSRRITWTEEDGLGAMAPNEPKKDESKPKQSFEMVVAADGSISIKNIKHLPQGQLVRGNVLVRTAKAPASVVNLTGKHTFKTAAEISDPRFQPWLPPQATEISVLGERGGHYARYKVSEADFMKFLDSLWKAKKEESAHDRQSMHGEGEPANPEKMAMRFKRAGWKPLNNAMTYYSPSKGSGAMTTYYFDRDAGIVYHDRGYW